MMVWVSFILISDRGFHAYFKYELILKFMTSIYLLNESTEYNRLIIEFVPKNILKNKKSSSIKVKLVKHVFSKLIMKLK